VQKFQNYGSTQSFLYVNALYFRAILVNRKSRYARIGRGNRRMLGGYYREKVQGIWCGEWMAPAFLPITRTILKKFRQI
jgi:hypothetical protein